MEELAHSWSHRPSSGPRQSLLAAYVPELAAALPAKVEMFDPPIRQELVRAVHQVLGALGPLVLVVEDVHWADEATRELLLLLARNPPQQLRLVLSYRSDDLPGSGCVLGPPYRRPVGVGGVDLRMVAFSERQVREFATAVLGVPAARAVSAELYARSAGLPLVVEEDLLVLAAREPRAGRAAAVLADARVPRALHEAVMSRVEGLDEDALALVQAAAVLARPAEEELLAAVADVEGEAAEAALTTALIEKVLVEPSSGRYGFRHELAARTVYESIPGPRRRRMHRRAVEALTLREPVPLLQIAHHTRRSSDAAAWVPRAVAAAEHAVRIEGLNTSALSL
ncbi:AAA family ATPase [Streptacidiphilus sp. PAMC 29251]